MRSRFPRARPRRPRTHRSREALRCGPLRRNRSVRRPRGPTGGSPSRPRDDLRDAQPHEIGASIREAVLPYEGNEAGPVGEIRGRFWEVAVRVAIREQSSDNRHDAPEVDLVAEPEDTRLWLGDLEQ